MCSAATTRATTSSKAQVRRAMDTPPRLLEHRVRPPRMASDLAMAQAMAVAQDKEDAKDGLRDFVSAKERHTKPKTKRRRVGSNISKHPLEDLVS